MDLPTRSSRPLVRLCAALLGAILAACSAQPLPSVEPSLTPTPTATAGTPPAASPSVAVSPSPGASHSPRPTAGPASSSPGPSASPSGGTPPTPAPALADGVAEQLQAALESQRAARGVPGSTAAVIFPDGSLWSGAVGSAALKPAVAATPDTPYVLGSITKTFVAALTLQLAEEGLLDLDDTLDRWLPDFPRAGRITLRQLLNHTSGVFNYFEHPDYNRTIFGQPNRTWRPRQILATFGGSPYFAPGTGFHYSNTGYVLLGLVIEAVTGATLGDEVERRFLIPLGLANTYLQGHGEPPPGAAEAHLRAGGMTRAVADTTNYRPTKSAATVAWAAGGMVASADDLATWCQALYGGELLTADSMSQLTDYDAGSAVNYGLGTRTRLLDGRRMFGHTGSLRGFMAVMWHFPDVDLTVVMLNNLGRINPNPMVDSLSRIALPVAAAYRPVAPAPSPSAVPASPPPPPSALPLPAAP